MWVAIPIDNVGWIKFTCDDTPDESISNAGVPLELTSRRVGCKSRRVVGKSA